MSEKSADAAQHSITFREFQMWLGGLLDGNERRDELPTLDQWRRVLVMLDRVVEGRYPMMASGGQFADALPHYRLLRRDMLPGSVTVSTVDAFLNGGIEQHHHPISGNETWAKDAIRQVK